jgi:hypothetical protein
VNALRRGEQFLAGLHEHLTQGAGRRLKKLTSITSVFCGDAGTCLLGEYEDA